MAWLVFVYAWVALGTLGWAHLVSGMKGREVETTDALYIFAWPLVVFAVVVWVSLDDR